MNSNYYFIYFSGIKFNDVTKADDLNMDNEVENNIRIWTNSPKLQM